MSFIGGVELELRPVIFRSGYVSIGDFQTFVLPGLPNVGIGPGVRVDAGWAIAIGISAQIAGWSNSSIAIGNHVSVGFGSGGCIAIGGETTPVFIDANSPFNIVLGSNNALIETFASYNVVLGERVFLGSNSTSVVALGKNLTIGNSGGSGASRVVALGEIHRVFDTTGHVLLGYGIGGYGNYDVAIGYDVVVSRSRSVGIGYQVVVDGEGSIVIGDRARCTALPSADNVVLGTLAESGSNAFSTVVIGHGAYAWRYQQVVMGASAVADGIGAISLGCGAIAGTGALGDGYCSMAMGYQATLTGDYGIALGFQSSVTAGYGIAFGVQTSSAAFAVSIGTSSTVTADYGIAISTGNSQVYSTFSYAVGHGIRIEATADRCVAIGTDLHIADGAGASVLIGYSPPGGHTIGTNSGGCIVIGFNSSVDADSPNCMLMGNGVYVEPLTSNCTIAGFDLHVGTGASSSILIGHSPPGGRTIGENSARAVLVGYNSSIGDDSPDCIVVGNSLSVPSDVVSTITMGFSATVTGSYAIALGSSASAGANEMVAGNSSATEALHAFTIRGYNGAALDTIRAVDNPGSGESGLVVVFNDGATTANKTLKAATSPPVGSLLAYFDP